MSEEFNESINSLDNISELEVFARFIANMVSSEVSKIFTSWEVTVAGGIIGSLAAAIVYMYFSQKSERERAEANSQKANDRLYAVLKESTELMGVVRNGLKNSEKSEKKTERTLDRMLNIIRGCHQRDKLLDDIEEKDDE
jgi:phosphate/sulfate permease